MPDPTSIERRAVIQGAAGIGLALGASGAAQSAVAQDQRTGGRFTGKRVLITGGSSGIGRAGARRVAAEGGRVAVTGQTPAHLDAVRGELPPASIVLRSDSGDPAAIPALVEAVRSMGGGLDGLWLNAAFATIAPLEDITAADFDRMMAVNVRGPMLQLAALSPLLNPGASVVVTASSSAYEGAELTPLYGSTKGAAIAMVRSWARQLAPRQIRVNSLVPGPIRTNIRRHLPEETRRRFETAVVGMVPLQRIGAADEAAAVALFLLSDDASYVSGSQYAVDGGMLMR
jgi:NAD(P)-dependent dehydrogenase (short-subunit alcohol dehydrogenase family)